MPLLNFNIYLENSFKLYILFGELSATRYSMSSAVVWDQRLWLSCTANNIKNINTSTCGMYIYTYIQYKNKLGIIFQSLLNADNAH